MSMLSLLAVWCLQFNLLARVEVWKQLFTQFHKKKISEKPAKLWTL
jgi:hypothetical protein